MAWQKLSVELKGEDAPVIVQTVADDWAQVRIEGGDARPMDLMFQVAHFALLRIGHGVPRDYAGFKQVLDGVPEDVSGTPSPLDVDPTNAAPSEGQQ